MPSVSAAAELGCIAAGGSEEQRRKVRDYAQALGRAFQVQDDILDVTSTDEELGKNVGSDRANEKDHLCHRPGPGWKPGAGGGADPRAVDALAEFEQGEFLIWLAQSLAKAYQLTDRMNQMGLPLGEKAG